MRATKLAALYLRTRLGLARVRREACAFLKSGRCDSYARPVRARSRRPEPRTHDTASPSPTRHTRHSGVYKQVFACGSDVCHLERQARACFESHSGAPVSWVPHSAYRPCPLTPCPRGGPRSRLHVPHQLVPRLEVLDRIHEDTRRCPVLRKEGTAPHVWLVVRVVHPAGRRSLPLVHAINEMHDSRRRITKAGAVIRDTGGVFVVVLLLVQEVSRCNQTSTCHGGRRNW